MHKLLKAAHHLKNVSDINNDPPATKRITANLASVIKPVVPTTRTLDFIDGNARMWALNTVIILRHYFEDEMAADKVRLKALGVWGVWGGC